jgi:hypothetical protein
VNKTNNNNNNKIPEQRTWKAHHQGATDSSHIGQCTHISESTYVKYKTFVMVNSITYIIYCNHRIAATLCTLETLFVFGI